MTANVTIQVARRDDALRVPAAALRFTPEGQSSKGPQVWRSDNGVLTPVPVKAGLSDGQFTEVVEGNLSVGDSLAVRQSTSNQSVRPAATASPFQFMQPQRRPGG
jgi:HlyD family secretion protein